MIRYAFSRFINFKKNVIFELKHSFKYFSKTVKVAHY